MHAPHKQHDVGASTSVNPHDDTRVKHAAATHGAKLSGGGVAGVLTLARATAKWRGHKKSKTVVESKALNDDEVAIMTGEAPHGRGPVATRTMPLLLPLGLGLT